ncbi:ATP-binding protein [Bradyrhizobium sp.]|uniref:ATP-binding protein n=1 Tax=Bradyrhizobium sp. TaxID=376 RepID=UPI003C74EC96
MPTRVLQREWLQLHSSEHASKWAVIAVLYLAAYIILEWASFIHVHKGLPITPWDPGLGVAFALMIRGGPLSGLILFAGMVVAETLVLQNDVDWPIDIGVAAITALSYTSVAALVQRYFRIDADLTHLRDVLMLLAAGLAGAVLDTVLLNAFLLAVGQFDMRDVVQVAWPLLIGDMIGIAVVTPLLLRFRVQERFKTHRLLSLAPEGALYFCIIGVALWLIVGSEGAHGFRLFYLLFVPVVIAAVRHGVDGACFSLAVTQFSLIGLLHFSGYGASEFTEFQTLALVLTVTGLIVGVVVSERKNSDRIARDAQARLVERQAEAAQVARVNLVSGMASALAHEINQPMTAARALGRSAQHLVRTPGSDLSRADSNLSAMLTHIDHAGDIVRRMRNFIRRGHSHVSTINTRDMLEEAMTLAHAEAFARHVRVDLDAPADLPDLHGDRVQLEQVVLNLVHNAVDAIATAGQSHGHVHVTARRHSAPPRVEIGVLDNGPGIEGELAGRLFDPLTTAKQDGLGLGLSICASIMEAHGGRVWLHSGEPGATEFRFTVPLDQSQER